MNAIIHLRELMGKATAGPLTLIRYDHGGGRLYKEEPRTLVADFFDEPDRELFYAARTHMAALLKLAEAAQEYIDGTHVIPEPGTRLGDLAAALAPLTADGMGEGE